MKILVIVDGFYPDESGGVVNSLREVIHGLVMRGHQVTVLAKRLAAGSPTYQRLDGYDFYRYFSPSRKSVFYRAYPLFYWFSLPWAVGRLCRHTTFDLAYIHNPGQVVGFNRAGVDIPVIYACHAPFMKEIELDKKRGKYGLLTPFLGPVLRLAREIQFHVLRQANLTITYSEFVKSEMESLQGNCRPQGKIEIIPLAGDTERFSFAENCEPAKKILGLPANRPILLTVRRLVARMGLENLIAAMALVREKYPDVLLVIGGRGYLRDELRAEIRSRELENHVRLLGFIPEEQLPLYYQAADLFVLPTTALEGFGLATIEALSCGTPVLGTPVGATPEILSPLGEEFLSADASAEALAEGILRWLESGTSCEVRRRCRDYCVSHFSLATVIPKLERLFVQVGGGR